MTTGTHDSLNIVTFGPKQLLHPPLAYRLPCDSGMLSPLYTTNYGHLQQNTVCIGRNIICHRKLLRLGTTNPGSSTSSLVRINKFKIDTHA